MRHFCRLVLVIVLGLINNCVKGQGCPQFSYPGVNNDTLVICPSDTPNFVLAPTIPAGTTITSTVWSTGQTSPGINVTNKGRYWVQMITAGGITCTDTLVVGVWGEGNHGNYKWYFGSNIGLDFSSGSPMPITGSSLNAPAGAAPISDPTGHILFYTDGNTIYGSNNQPITGGSNLGGNTTVDQSTLVVPSLKENNVYYTFAINNSNQLQYSTVDLSKNNGLGAVDTTVTLTLPGDAVSPEVAGVYDSTGGFWVATEQGNNLVAYQVSNSGVSTTPVTSSSGSSSPGSDLKFSDDGTKAAEVVAPNEVLVYNFSKGTGKFTVSDTIKVQNPYAVEFASNSSNLYVTTGAPGQPDGGHVYQYNLTQGSSALVNKSKYLLTTDSSIGYYGMQLASNGQIYIATNNGYLATIGSPYASDSGANFQNDAVSLNGSNVTELPNFVSNYFTSSSWALSSSAGCAGQGIPFYGESPDSVYLWDIQIKQGSSLILSFDTTNSELFYRDITTITAPNTYIATITANYHCYSYTANAIISADTILYDTITIYQKPTPPRIIKTLCNTPSYTLDAGSYYSGISSTSSPVSYIWTNKTPLIGNDSVNAAAVALGTDSTLIVDTTGTYYIYADNNGCVGVDSSTITFLALPQNFLSNATLCTGQADTLAVPVSGAWTVQWNTTSTQDTIIVTSGSPSSTKYSVTLTDTANTSCIAKDSAVVTFIQTPVVSLGPNQTVCTGATETLDAQNPGFSYLWSTGDTTEKITVKTMGAYYVEVYKGKCAVISDTVTINYEAYPALILPPEVTFCSKENPTVTLYGGTAASYNWSSPQMTDSLYTDSIKVDTSGTFTLQAFSAIAKCKSTATVIVNDICSPELFVPSAFSPNGDGRNDIFQIYGESISTYDMRIFDKWGELIFVSADMSVSWDGSYKGQPVEQGVYTWKIVYTGKALNGVVSKVQEGNVTVLK